MSEIISLADGKYEFEKDDKGFLRCKRYGEYWRDFIGDNAVLSLFDYAIELKTKSKQ
jgi:hypothetical protein